MKNLEKITVILNDIVKNEKRISQKELADKMGVSPVAVNKWLNGGSIDTSKIPLLCKTLNITPNELFGFNNTNLTDDEIHIINKLRQHPKFKDAIKKLLDI